MLNNKSKSKNKKTIIDDESIIYRVTTFKLNIESIENIINIKNIDNEFNIIENNINNKLEIMSFINIRCNLQELINIFYISKTNNYNIIMNDIYQNNFIRGKIIKKISSDNDHIILNGNQITVKKCLFIKSNLFKSYIKWCYIENYMPYDNGMMITFLTINEYGDIQDIVGVITINVIYKNMNIYEHYSLFNINFHGYTLNKSRISKRYLKQLANSLQRLPYIINKNRISTQKQANLSLCKVYNKECINCQKTFKCLKLFNKRCAFCSFYICNNCIILKQIRTLDKYNSNIYICKRCINCINRCDYSNIKFYDNLLYPKIIPDKKGKHHAGNRLVKYLKKKRMEPAVNNLINIIEEQKKEYHMHMFKDFENKERDSLCFDDTNEIDRLFNIIPSLQECELSFDIRRSYPMLAPSEYDPNEPITPIPNNEEERNNFVSRLRMDSLKESEELITICDFINKEMECFCVSINLVEKESVHTISASDMQFVASYPRCGTICQHTIMDNYPTIIYYPEADIRYENLPLVTENDLKYYFGTPLLNSEGLVLGTLCCIDTKIRQLTVSQYSVITDLAKTASTIIEYKGLEI